MNSNKRKKWLEQILFAGEEGAGAGAGRGQAAPAAEPTPAAAPTPQAADPAPPSQNQQGPSDEELMRAMAGKPEKTDATTTAAPVSTSETVTKAPTATTVTVTEAPKAAPATGLTAEDLKSVLEKMPQTVAEAIKAGQPPPAAQPQPQFKPWRPSPELIERVFEGGEKAVEALGEVADNSTMQAIKIIAPYFEQRFQAVNDYIVGQERQAAKVEFGKTYPDLEPFTDAAEEYANKLLAAGNKFASRKDLFEAVAKGVRGVVADYAAKIEASKQRGAVIPGAAPAGLTTGIVSQPTMAPPSLPGTTASANGGGRRGENPEVELMKLMASRSGAR